MCMALMPSYFPPGYRTSVCGMKTPPCGLNEEVLDFEQGTIHVRQQIVHDKEGYHVGQPKYSSYYQKYFFESVHICNWFLYLRNYLIQRSNFYMKNKMIRPHLHLRLLLRNHPNYNLCEVLLHIPYIPNRPRNQHNRIGHQGWHHNLDTHSLFLPRFQTHQSYSLYEGVHDTQYISTCLHQDQSRTDHLELPRILGKNIHPSHFSSVLDCIYSLQS